MNMETLMNVKNTLTLNFNLRQPRGNKETNVYAVININNRQVKMAIGLKINPWQWDKKHQCPKVNANMTEQDRSNALIVFNQLNAIREAFQGYYFNICANGTTPNEAEIYNILNQNNNSENMTMGKKVTAKKAAAKEEVITATALLEKALEVYKVMHKVEQSSLKQYKSWLKAFKNYCEEINKDSISMLTDDGVKEFEYYLRENEETSTKVRNSVKVLKILINNAITEHPRLKKYGVKRLTIAMPKEEKSENKKFVLEEDEIEAIKHCEGLTPYEEEIRDLFMLALYSGQRASDLPKFFSKEYDIIDGVMQFYNQKKKVETFVIITSEIENILNKYKDGFKYVKLDPSKMHNQITEAIKNIAKKANLNRTITYIADKKEYKKPLHEMLSVHIARHTFITRLQQKDVNVNLIAMQSGHKDVNTIQKYYTHLSPEDKRKKLLNIDKEENNSEFIYNRGKADGIKELVEETKDVLVFLGANYIDIKHINNLDVLLPMLYVDYESRITSLGISVGRIKGLWNDKEKTLKDKKEILEQWINDFKAASEAI